MAAERSRIGGPSIGLNLVAMIDVTFLLLIYFLAATEFRSASEVLQVELPRRGASAAMVLQDDPLIVHVVSTGDGPRDLAVRLDNPWPQVDDAGGLLRFLRRSTARKGHDGGLFTIDHPVVIRPATGTRWEHAVEAFNAVLRAQFTNVTMGTPS